MRSTTSTPAATSRASFASLTEALGAAQVAITLIRIPPHCDFEQGTGHHHDELEELYLVGRGTLTMRFGDEIRRVSAGSVARVSPATVRSHRNEGDEPVELWAISRASDARRRDQGRRLLGGLAGRPPAPRGELKAPTRRTGTHTVKKGRLGV